MTEENRTAQDNTMSVIEALLFSSDKPLMLEQVRAVLENFDSSEIRAIIEQLGAEYEKTNRGMRIVEVAGGFQMVSPRPFLKKVV